MLGACTSSRTSATNGPSSTTSTRSTAPTTSTGPGASLPGTDIAVFAECQNDYRVVVTAVTAYQALNGTPPSPPAPWSAAAFEQDYAPLTGSAKGGPFMQSAPRTTHYVIQYDSSGHVWIEPPGQYDATYVPGRAASDGTCALAIASGR